MTRFTVEITYKDTIALYCSLVFMNTGAFNFLPISLSAYP